MQINENENIGKLALSKTEELTREIEAIYAQLNALSGGSGGQPPSSAKGLPIGTILCSAVLKSESWLHILDGSVLSETNYPDFYNWIINAINQNPESVPTCQESEYDNDLNEFGQCGKFVVDLVNKTIRIPLIARFISGISDVAQIGSSEHDQIVNITANMNQPSCSIVPSYALSDPTIDGAFEFVRKNAYIITVSATQRKTNSIVEFNFNASNCVRTGDEVQPRNVRYPFYIVVCE